MNDLELWELKRWWIERLIGLGGGGLGFLIIAVLCVHADIRRDETPKPPNNDPMLKDWKDWVKFIAMWVLLYVFVAGGLRLLGDLNTK